MCIVKGLAQNEVEYLYKVLIYISRSGWIWYGIASFKSESGVLSHGLGLGCFHTGTSLDTCSATGANKRSLHAVLARTRKVRAAGK